MSETMRSRIEGAKLSPNDKIVLEYILKNQEAACFQTSAEIAGQLGVSASAVVRMSSKLGFESFSRFKRAIQEDVAKKRKNQPTETIPYEKIKNYEGLTEEEMIGVIKRTALKNIEKDQTTADYMSYRRAAALLSGPGRVFIVGFRACAGFAASLGVMLACVRPAVYVVNGSQPVVDFLVDLTKEDTVIAISYERYSSDTVFAVEMARRAGSHIVALTDKYTSPVCSGAEIVILNSTDSLSFHNSYVSLAMSMDILVDLVSRRNKERSEERLMKMEEYLRETGQY